MMAEGYAATVFLNNYFSQTTGAKKQFSIGDKIDIGASLLMGIDVIITPALSGGRTLHEIAGLSMPAATETFVQYGELAVASLGQIYHALRNFQIIAQDKKEPATVTIEKRR
ncbi:MAG: hypothetical protein V1725_00660 [archaeon]